jgi:hypothetical protein
MASQCPAHSLRDSRAGVDEQQHAVNALKMK